MSKHTTGPWVYVQGRPFPVPSYWIKHRSPGHDGGFFAEVYSMHHTAEAQETALANARLIAAAPEMLELLKEWHEREGWGEDVDHEVFLATGDLIARIESEDAT